MRPPPNQSTFKYYTLGIYYKNCDGSKEMAMEFFVEGNGNPLQYSCLENPRDRGT